MDQAQLLAQLNRIQTQAQLIGHSLQSLALSTADLAERVEFVKQQIQQQPATAPAAAGQQKTGNE
jgi:hypothetical protein